MRAAGRRCSRSTSAGLSSCSRSSASATRLLHELRSGSVAYNFLVHAYSTLTLRRGVQPGAVRPGEAAIVTASLDEYGVPVDHRASVWVEVQAPNGTLRRVALSEVEPGVFSGAVRTHVPGLYSLRCRARGHALDGRPFTRERAFSVAAARGDAGRPGSDAGDLLEERDERLCKLLACVVGNSKTDLLGVAPDVWRKCLGEFCRPRRRQPPRERPQPARKPSVREAKIARLVEPPPPPRFPPNRTSPRRADVRVERGGPQGPPGGRASRRPRRGPAFARGRQQEKDHRP